MNPVMLPDKMIHYLRDIKSAILTDEGFIIDIFIIRICILIFYVTIHKITYSYLNASVGASLDAL